MNRTPVKVGLLGAGYIFDAHAKALAALTDVSIHAVCDASRGRAERAAAKYGIPVVIDSIAQLAASNCDVVHILVPPAMHLDAAFAMIEGGKSVFLEKPMGLDSAACKALCERAQAVGVSVGVNHNFLFTRSYERLRAGIKSGELGRIDNISINWHFALAILQFGPFDNWMLGAPANIVFELGSHVGAFVVDLIGLPEIASAVAANPIAMPGGGSVFRHWTAIAQKDATTATLSLSIAAGHADRILRVRGRGASAQLDYGRDTGWRDLTTTDNPMFDSYTVAKTAGKSLLGDARGDLLRRLRAALRKRPEANPFDESIYRSIKCFYSGGVENLDPRHDGRFGTDVIRLCELISTAAGAGTPSRAGRTVTMPTLKTKPTILVVGGSGFIGRHLVRRLVDRGQGVRVLTRNPYAAALEFHGLPVEIVAGSHGDPDVVMRVTKDITAVYHLAKCEGKRWEDYVSGDIEPTRVLAQAAISARVQRFIYTGTIASYASGRLSDVIDNRTLVDPSIARRSNYPRSKAVCEALLQSMHRESGLPLVILRPGVVIGPGSPPAHLGIGRFTSETRVDYWGRGDTPLPLVLVDDVADALVLALDTPAIEGQQFLLTSPPLLTAREYVVELSSYMGTRIDARPRSAWRNWTADLTKELVKNAIRHPNRRWPTLHDWRCQSHCARFDSQMTEKTLGWQPVASREVMVRRGIADTIDWFLK